MVSTNYAGLYAYLYKRETENVLILVNSTVSDLTNVALDIKGISCQEISIIERENGNCRKLTFEKKDDKVILPDCIKEITTCTLVIK